MAASVDNTSNAVEWAIAEMINQTAILQKAVEELDKVVGTHRLVQELDLPNLNYIKSCAKEAFRLHPFAPFNVPHVSMSDTIITGYSIPKGSHVLLSRLGLGRNPRIWDDPLTFNPERHLRDNSTEVALTESEFRLLSFSSGRRGCIGVLLGSTMTTMLLARLLQCFTWSAPATVDTPICDPRKNPNDLRELLVLGSGTHPSTGNYPRRLLSHALTSTSHMTVWLWRILYMHSLGHVWEIICFIPFYNFRVLTESQFIHIIGQNIMRSTPVGKSCSFDSLAAEHCLQ
ncbi:hypothetical protein LguiB_027143 [Lonicera macranthoides]